MDKPPDHFRVHRLPNFPLGEIAHEVMAARMSGRDIIDLGQVNPNLGPPAAAVDKLVQASIQPHNHRYSSSQGITRLRHSVSDWYKRRFNVPLDPESEVVVTMGTKEGLSHLLMAVSSGGDSMLIPTPSYPIHTAAISLAGANAIGVPLPLATAQCHEPGLLSEKDEVFFEELDRAYEHTWPRPVLMVLSFPHNPTSLVVTEGFFERLVDYAGKRSIWLVHDFAYADLGYDGYHTPSILQTPAAKEIAVEFCSFSKGMNMPGWRVGFAAGNHGLVAALKRVKSYLDCGPFQPLQIAAVRALDVYEQTTVETAEVYRERRDIFCRGLKEIGWQFIQPKATLYVWAEIPARHRAEGSMCFSNKVLAELDIATCPGMGFGRDADGYIRFALLEPEARLRLAISRLKTLAGAI